MSTPPGPRTGLREAADYLDEVAAALADLPGADRDEMLADTGAHLHELLGEGGGLPTRLGPPRAYAEELRAAAGLPSAGPAPAAPEGGPVRPSGSRWWPLAGLVAGWACTLSGGTVRDGRLGQLVPGIRGHAALGVLAVAAAVAAAVLVGAASRRWRAAAPFLVVSSVVVVAVAAFHVATVVRWTFHL